MISRPKHLLAGRASVVVCHHLVSNNIRTKSCHLWDMLTACWHNTERLTTSAMTACPTAKHPHQPQSSHFACLEQAGQNLQRVLFCAQGPEGNAIGSFRSPQASNEPWSKLPIRGLYGAFTGSFEGYLRATRLCGGVLTIATVASPTLALRMFDTSLFRDPLSNYLPQVPVGFT